MTINFRNRVLGITNTMAGNYEGNIWLHSSDCGEVECIRARMLTHNTLCSDAEESPSGQPVSPTPTTTATPTLTSMLSNQQPTWWQLLMFRISVITNWSSCYSDIHLPSATQSIHIPIMQMSCMFPNNCILFRLTATTVGVLLNVSSVPSALILNNPALEHVRC